MNQKKNGDETKKRQHKNESFLMADDSLDCVANNLQFGSTNQTRLEIASSQSVKTPQGARDRTNPNELNWNEKKNKTASKPLPRNRVTRSHRSFKKNKTKTKRFFDIRLHPSSRLMNMFSSHDDSSNQVSTCRTLKLDQSCLSSLLPSFTEFFFL